VDEVFPRQRLESSRNIRDHAEGITNIRAYSFEDLDPHRFEDLVRQVVCDFKDWQSIEGKGRSGSDDGIDIRAFERLTTTRSEDDEDEDAKESPHPMMGNQWIIQSPRQLGIGNGYCLGIADVDGNISP
jgi:hypothetical protein